ncbi:sulfur carrier protein ThiS [Marinibaculum pumilum]|uniref:Sulfur carrier protein ThiS n=1 Tax=Marinibaculum pumilum TaxID=1766165 RepID=A0ABV7L4D4_9PROT
MRVVLNGEATSVEAATLEQLCADLGLDGPRVATAVNGDFVPRDARAATALKEGDTIEVVAPMQGG